MRNSEESSTRPPSSDSSKSSTGGTSSPSANAFSASFLLAACRLAEAPASAPPGLASGAYWAGPWEVETLSLPHGAAWTVVRRGESARTGARPAAVTRHRVDALLVAATLPALAVPNHLSLGEKPKRSGTPFHDGTVCLGHLTRPEPQIVEYLHVARALLASPDSFALAIESQGPEDIPILGRALMRRLQAP